MEHIAQITIDPNTWVGYQSWFWIKNFGPKDFEYNNGTLILKNSHIIAEFYNHHPNLDYSVVSHPHVS